MKVFKESPVYTLFAVLFWSVVGAGFIASIFTGLIVKIFVGLPETDLIKNMDSDKILSVEYRDMPEFLVKATAANFDPQYFNHRGIDFQRLSNYVTENLLLGNQNVEYIPTITERVAKMALAKVGKPESLKGYFTGDYAFIQEQIEHVRELILALKMELKFGKGKIFEIYANNSEFEGKHGVVEASTTFFNKRPVELTSAECAILSSMLKNNTGNDLCKNPEAAQKIKKQTLYNMKKSGFINETEFNEINIDNVKFSN